MDKKTITKEISDLKSGDIPGYILAKIEEAHHDGHEEGYEEGLEEVMDSENDSAEGLAFALSVLQDAKLRGLTLDEIIQDLTIRSCRFMQPFGLPETAYDESIKQSQLTLTL